MKPVTSKSPPKISLWFILLPCLLLLALLATGIYIWRSYRSELMQNQEEQLLLVTRTATRNLEITFSQYRESLELLRRMDGGEDSYRSFLWAYSRHAADVCWLDEEGTVAESVNGLMLADPVPLVCLDGVCTVLQYTGGDNRHYLGFCGEPENGRALCLVIDEEDYYSDLMSGLRIGTNGYLLVKTSTGRIVMHPDPSQWGIDVIEGRRERYPGLDLSSLADMVQHQIEEPSGVYEYYSYWWTDPELPRVKKISTHVHADLGDDFWVVSAVVDYSDFYTPIAEGVGHLTLIFIAISAILLLLSIYIGKLLRDQRRDSREIAYLRELSDTLEELHRHEENIAHQQRLQVMGAMTGGIAHEFNNFLTPIMGFAELLMAELPPESDAYDSAREICEATDKAKEVVRQVSAMSRKNVETVYKCVPAQKALERTLRMIDSVCPEQVRLESQLELKDESILGNRTQLDQVLLNLCVNAIHAMGPEGGVLTITARRVTLETVRAMLPEERVCNDWAAYVQLDVADTGCGMDSDVLRHIFEPFFTTKKSGEGTGLGLSLAEQIVRAHRGFLSVDSAPGKGSTFHLLLPVLEQSAADESLRWGQEQKLRLVLADDNAKVLELLERSFQKLGLPLAVCGKKEEALAQLQRGDVDVLAIDQSLEDGDGIEFCMSIQGKYPGVIKLLMVDSVTREVVEARRRGIINGYVQKPVSDATLLEAIHNSRESME